MEEWHRYLRDFASKCTKNLSSQDIVYQILLENSDDAAGAWGMGDTERAEELLREELIKKGLI